jgi:hypothetical protein
MDVYKMNSLLNFTPQSRINLSGLFVIIILSVVILIPFI